MATSVKTGGQVGRSLPRLEARDKVTGRAEYTHLMQVPGMLYGKIFRSTVAHGRIKSIDTSEALKVSGVFAVYTSDSPKYTSASDGRSSIMITVPPTKIMSR